MTRLSKLLASARLENHLLVAASEDGKSSANVRNVSSAKPSGSKESALPIQPG